MSELNRKSPAVDTIGRLLYQGVFTDGINVSSLFFYSYNDRLAFKKAKTMQENSCFNLQLKRITRVDQKSYSVAGCE